jgi:hypothetical protein
MEELELLITYKRSELIEINTVLERGFKEIPYKSVRKFLDDLNRVLRTN